ncbi:MAG: LON peptidase substrate-binding domain-containing protein [Actinobacteria bacterium]|nr:LON peptidase substrate-binding domain-containing protein [Actinomycetota bacterium]
MDLGVFALHTVMYPGQGLELTVFEERYRRLMEDVLPEGTFAVVAIRTGREVGGDYDPHRVGVRVVVDGHEVTDEGTYRVAVRAEERIRLVGTVAAEPYAVWTVERFPEAVEPRDRTGPAAVVALAAWRRFLDAAEVEATGELPTDPTDLSYTLAATLPTLLPDRQALLEVPGPAERLERLAGAYRLEAGLLRALKGQKER